MPIHINLLAEEQSAEEMRRRDPVKRAAVIGGLLVLMALGWSAVTAINARMARESLTAKLTDIASKTNEFREVEMEQRQLGQAKFRLDALHKLQSARFLQGNLLDALQHATVDGVQLTGLRLDQSFSAMTDARKTNDTRVKETIVLHLNARDSSANPGELISKFQSAIARQAYFVEMLNKTNPVQLAGPPSGLQTEGDKPYVRFGLDCYFLNQIR